MTPAPDPLANPFADLEDDLPWEEPKGRSHDRLQLLIEHLGSGHRPGGHQGLQQARARQSERQYLGPHVSAWPASEPAVQYAKAPIDHGRDTPGRMLRIFERGHVMEDCMVAWLRDAGFDLRTRKADGEQFGFSVADGRLQNHIDGVIVGGPEASPIPRSGNVSVSATSPGRSGQKGLTLSKPVYAAQVAIYQAYLELHEHPAIFTALNADTMEIYTELVPFDAALAQRMSDRAVKVITATGRATPAARLP